MRTILHIDMNSFYASIECLHHPEIRENPVSVGGDEEQRHGIILASNTIAKKKYGIKTGEALWQARQKCPDLIIVPPDFRKYMRFSAMAREIYLDYTSQVEPFGLDEAWLDVTGSSSALSGRKIADEISRRIKFELGLTVSIGVSFNKIFAKLGSDYKKPDAITEISQENYQAIAWPLPVSDPLYVGRATQRKLHNLCIHTIGDLANAPIKMLRLEFGKIGDVLYSFANGTDLSPVAEFDNQPTIKSIGNSTTTPRDLENNQDVKIVLTVLADSVARRLREQGFKGRTVSISVRDNTLFPFTRQHTLTKYTNITTEISDAGMELFQKSYRWLHPIRSLGISISDLTGDSICTQTDLFADESEREKRENLDHTVDTLKNRFGTYSVQPAIWLADRALSGFDPKQEHVIHPVGFFH